ncbi:MAG: amidohydrolase family protein, partial [Pseudomonadota bacterium]
VHHVPEAYLHFVETNAAFGIRLAALGGENVRLAVGPLQYALTKTFFDAQRLTRRMDEMGVERAVLSLATPFVNYDVAPELACAAAELYNDEIAFLHAASPHRFEGWAYLPVQQPEAAAKELRRAVQDLGLVGGYLPSNVKGRYLDSAELAPIFAAASELDVPLFLHPSNPPARERMADYELAVVAGYLFDTTLNIFNMIFGGLLDRYPALRLCCAHLGGYALMLRARMQREIDTNTALAAHLNKPLDEYLRSIYFDTVCFEPAYLRSVVEAGAADRSRLLLGSDTPFPLGEPDPVGFVGRSFGETAPELADNLLFRNAKAFLKINA